MHFGKAALQRKGLSIKARATRCVLNTLKE